MTCKELRQEYVTFALGIADDPERAEIAEHLSRKCPNCVPGVSSAMATISAISGAVDIAEPPKRLRRRVLAMVEPEPKRSWARFLVPWAVAAALALALVAVWLPQRRVNEDTARLEQALSILNDPATRDVTFGETPQPSKGRVFVSPSRGVVFIAAGLPRIPSGRTFELWLIPANGKPVPAGTFQSAADATAVYVHPGPPGDAAVVAVTVEPLGGSPQPTTTPFIVAKLSGS